MIDYIVGFSKLEAYTIGSWFSNLTEAVRLAQQRKGLHVYQLTTDRRGRIQSLICMDCDD